MKRHHHPIAAVSPTSKTEGTWNSIHVFEAEDNGSFCYYKLTSTVILHLGTKTETDGEVDFSGYLTRQTEQRLAVQGEAGHIVNIGKVRDIFECLLGHTTSRTNCGAGNSWSRSSSSR